MCLINNKNIMNNNITIFIIIYRLYRVHCKIYPVKLSFILHLLLTLWVRTIVLHYSDLKTAPANIQHVIDYVSERKFWRTMGFPL